MVLVTLAGNGWMRGVQDTVRPLRYVLAGNGLSALLCPFLVHGIGSWDGWGLEGSAVANVVAQTVSAGLFLGRARNASPLPRPTRCACARCPPCSRPALALGATCCCAASGSRPASCPRRPGRRPVRRRIGGRAPDRAAAVAFQALVLDAVAIAAQSLVGRRAGRAAGRRRRAARALRGPVTRYGPCSASGSARAVRRALAVLPGVFTSDPAVLAAIRVPWWFFAALQPIAGVVFALDGVLLGAGDAAFLRTSTLVAALPASCR